VGLRLTQEWSLCKPGTKLSSATTACFAFGAIFYQSCGPESRYHRSRPQGDAIYRISYDSVGIQTPSTSCRRTFVNAIILVAMSTIMLAMNWETGGTDRDGDHAVL